MKDSQPTSDMQVRRKAFAMLHVPLSVNEKAELGQKLANLHGEIDKLEAERKAANDTFKAKIEILEIQLNGSATELRGGTREQRGELEVLFDYKTCNIVVRRKDTGAIEAERTMETQERQLEFGQTRVPGQILSIGGRTFDLEVDGVEEPAATKGKKAKVIGIDGGKKDAPAPAAESAVVEEPAPAPAPAPTEDPDDPPFGREPAEPAPATPPPVPADAVAPFAVGSKCWLDDSTGKGIGPEYLVEGVRPSVTKGQFLIACTWTVDGKTYRQDFPSKSLTANPPGEKKTKKAKPKFVQGAQVIGPDGKTYAINTSSMLEDGTFEYRATRDDGAILNFAESELQSSRARKKAPK